MRLGSSPYTWLRRLGSGSSGVVWAVEREGRQFAVKILRAAPSPAHREAVRREMRIGPLIAEHPGVVGVRRVEEVGEVLHLEMDLVRGPSLAQVLEGRLRERQGALPASVVVPWMVQVLEALHWVGQRVAPERPASFLHRDIKPANLLLDPSGRVRITDFGIARAEVDLGFQTTHTGVVKGSPRFMAPEVLLEKQPDARADQFSVGVVLFELLTGVPLHVGRDLAETLMMAVQVDVERRLQIVRGPTALVDVLRRMLQKEPAARYPDALAAVEALRVVPIAGPAVADLLPELLGYGADADDVGADETGEITAPVDEQDAAALTDPGFIPRSTGDTFSFLGPPGATLEGTMHRMALSTFVPLDDAPTLPGSFEDAPKPGFDELEPFGDADATTDVSDLLGEPTPAEEARPRLELPKPRPQPPRPIGAPLPAPTPLHARATLDDQLAALDRHQASEAPTQVLDRGALRDELERALDAGPRPAPRQAPAPSTPAPAQVGPSGPARPAAAPGWVRRHDEPWLLVLALLAVVFGALGVLGVAVVALWLGAAG